MLDAATMLFPAGVISANTDGTPLLLHPRQLPTCSWVIAMTTPPAAAATFTLSVATVSGGPFTTISTCVWPAGTSGSKQLSLGASGKTAQFMNNQAVWIRTSVATAGALTLGGSWLTTASDGSFGLGSRSYALDAIGAL